MPDLREQLQTTLGDSLTLEQELGGGGMSRVFVADDAALGRKVVVKVLPPEMAAAVSIDRFRREIQLAAQLQHPHIVPLLAAGQTDGLPYYTMPYVRGEALRARLLKGELPVSECVRILREVASALAYAHHAGVVHRDIKPENILLSGGSAVVTDFGVAKALTVSSGTSASSLTSLGVAIGTPAYMAPEQATADPNIDNRADIYSLGVVAYEMLCGSTPFPGRSPQATLAAHVTEHPEQITRRRPTVPPLLAALVMRCLEKHAADRPQTASEVMHGLDALTTPGGGLAPTGRLESSSRPATKLWMIPSFAAIAIVVGLALYASVRQRRESIAAQKESPAIAVLPFESVGNPDGKEFADGMTEEVTNRLSSLRGLRVIGRQSAKSYANTTKTPQQIANELNVKYLLTGTVRWDKNLQGSVLVRVSPALLRADDATQVWGEAYQTVLQGMFDVQSRVATEVANALNVNLLEPEREALDAKPTANVEAYTLFLRGKDIVEQSLQTEMLRQGISMLEKATQLDPRFVSAWAYLAAANTELFWNSTDRSASRLEKARQALRRASALDPDNPDLHLARGIYLYHGERDYDAALKEFTEVTHLRPNDASAPVYVGAIRRRQGEWEKSVESFKDAIELEPRNGTNMLDVATTLIILGRYDEAEAYVDRGQILSPGETDGVRLKARIAVSYRGNVPEAIQHLRDASRTIQPRSAVIGLLQSMVWPAIEDPMLRKMILDAVPSADVTRGSTYRARAEAYYYTGDVARARETADSAAAAIRDDIAMSPFPDVLYQSLGFVEAIRGRRADALEAYARAENAMPEERDHFGGADRENEKAVALAILGDRDAALAAISKRLAAPGGMSKALVRLHPAFAGLRADPRFQRLVEGS